MCWKGQNRSKKELHKLADTLQTVTNDLDSEEYKPDIYYQTNEGDLTDNVKEIVNKQDVELIVMGGRSHSSLDHFFRGSDTLSIINKEQCPVIVIPPKAEFEHLQRVIFATNFEQEDIHIIEYFINLNRLFDCKLDIVHVRPLKEKGLPKAKKEEEFIRKMSEFDYPFITYKEITEKNVVDGLNHICQNTHTDLLAMAHHHHSFFSNLLEHSTTKEALSHQQVPIMVFPDKEHKR